MFGLGGRARELAEINERLAMIEAALTTLGLGAADKSAGDASACDTASDSALDAEIPNEAAMLPVKAIPMNDAGIAAPSASPAVAPKPWDVLRCFADELRGLHRELEQTDLSMAA